MLDQADQRGDPVLGLVFLRGEEEESFSLIVDGELVVSIALSAVHNGERGLDFIYGARRLEGMQSRHEGYFVAQCVEIGDASVLDHEEALLPADYAHVSIPAK